MSNSRNARDTNGLFSSSYRSSDSSSASDQPVDQQAIQAKLAQLEKFAHRFRETIQSWEETPTAKPETSKEKEAREAGERCVQQLRDLNKQVSAQSVTVTAIVRR